MAEIHAETGRAKFMDFPTEEYLMRLDRVRALLAAAEIDAVVLTDPANLVYFSGYRSFLFQSKFRPFILVIPAQAEPVLILPNLEFGVGRRMSWIADVRGWGARGYYSDRPDFLSIIKDVIVERRLGRAHVGFELAAGQRLGLTLDQFEAIRNAFLGAGCEVSNCSEVIWAVRFRKSPREIAYLRAAGQATDAGYLAALDMAREGVSEAELSKAAGIAMMRSGADTPGFLIVQSGRDRYDMTNAPASDRKLKSGDMVVLDMGALHKGYWGDLTRGFFIGSASKKQRAYYEAILEVFMLTKSAVVPGIPIEEVDRVAEDAIVRLGYGERIWHRTGHAIGLDVHELPSVAKGDETILEPGMVFTVEPGIYDFESGAFRIEDVVVVTESGHESLNATAPTRLIIK
jgi:Xaa-Pro dipeptidase